MNAVYPQPISFDLRPQVVQPDFTIAIPTFRRLELLQEAVNSALEQRFDRPYEVIVVDNDSGDASREWVLARARSVPRLGYFQNRDNLGMVGNWNQCCALARGEFVTVLHDDDKLGPDFLRTIDQIPARNKSLRCCQTFVAPNDDGRWTVESGLNTLKPRHLLTGSVSPFPGVVFRKSDWIKVGGFDPNEFPSSDVDFWLKLLCLADGVRSQSIQAFYRISQQQGTAIYTKELLGKMDEIRSRIVEKSTGSRAVDLYLKHCGQSALKFHLERYNTATPPLFRTLRRLWNGLNRRITAYILKQS